MWESALRSPVGIIEKVSESLLLWRIPSYLSNTLAVFASPQFSMIGVTWNILAYPNGWYGSSPGWMMLQLVKHPASPHDMSLFLHVRLGVTANNTRIPNSIAERIHGTSYVARKVIQHRELMLKQECLITDGFLRVFCEIHKLSPDVRFNPFNVPLRQPLPGASYQDQATRRSTNKVLQDLKELLVSGKDSDLIIRVNDKDFKVHRLILQTRWPSFSKKFQQTIDKDAEVVIIDDVSSDCFFYFLNYIYTGSINNVSLTNMLALYDAAVEYEVEGLKEVCANRIVSSITTKNFCSVMTFCLRHEDMELKGKATSFFVMNWNDIIWRDEWKEFVCKHPNTGGGLLCKIETISSRHNRSIES